VTVFFELLAVAALLLLNAFFVASEYALVTARRTRLRELEEAGSRRARAALAITANPPRFIAAMQLGVTGTSLAIGAVGEPVLARVFDPFLAGVLAFGIAFLLITYLHVVVGELVPKGFALGHSESIAIAVSGPVRMFFFVFKPLIWILQRSSDLALQALGLEPPGAEDTVYSEAELKMLLSRSADQGELQEDEQEMLYKVFDFADKEVADVMVPRPEVVALSVDLPPEQCLAAVIESPYTRYPVYRDSLEQIVGILHVRDLFSAIANGGLRMIKVEELVRPAPMVPETKDLAAMLKEFRRTNQHMAIVVDEYGEMEGIVTLEDLLEEIVGEIEDEFDLPDETVERIDEGRIRVHGTFPIDDFNEQFGKEMPHEDFHTLAGFVFGQLGRGPALADEVLWDGLRFTVIELDGARIEKLEVEFLEEGPEAEEPVAESA
jgi:putative hemolysin